MCHEALMMRATLLTVIVGSCHCYVDHISHGVLMPVSLPVRDPLGGEQIIKHSVLHGLGLQ